MSRLIIVSALFVSLLISCNGFFAQSSKAPVCRTLCIRRAEEGGAAPAAVESGGIKAQLQADMKAAMKAKDKEKLAGVRY